MRIVVPFKLSHQYFVLTQDVSCDHVLALGSGGKLVMMVALPKQQQTFGMYMS